MDFKVYMLAFMNSEIRYVHISNKLLHECTTVHNLLNSIYLYGQNEVQPMKDRCSVSIGDVIEIQDQKWLVISIGFFKMSEEDWNAYKRIPRLDRRDYCYDKSESPDEPLFSCLNAGIDTVG